MHHHSPIFLECFSEKTSRSERTHGKEGHGDCPNEDVRDGEGGYEVVGRLSDLPVHGKADDDQEVAECGENDTDSHQHGDENSQGHPERSWPTRGTTVLTNKPVILVGQ